MRDKVTLEIEPIENGFLVRACSFNQLTKKTACRTFEEVLQKVYEEMGPTTEGTFHTYVQKHFGPNEEDPE